MTSSSSSRVYPDTSESEPELVYAQYKHHCSGERVHTDLAITNALRDAYPDHDVTGISKHDVNLIGFARAGHASLQIKTDNDHFLADRSYQPPENRLQGDSGKLSNRVSFGAYDITFNAVTYTFYVAEWIEQGRMTIFKNYLLTPKQELSATDGSTSAPDDLLLAAGKWTHELHNEIYVYDHGNWDKNKKLWDAVQNSSWDDVILDPVMKATLIADVEKFFDSQELYAEFSVPWKRGIILHGTPGCGKTISIKALMNTLGKRDFSVASLYVKTFKNCRGAHWSIMEIFEKARAMAPCLLIFEDLDSLVVDKVRSYFLNEVDGLEDNDGILMIGSTNHLDRLDPGIAKRPSRFDRKYFFRLPGFRERVLYAEYWKKKLERNNRIDFADGVAETVAQLTDGFSFAYMKELFVQTLLTIVGAKETDLNDEESDDSGEMVEIADAATVIESSSRVAVGEKVVSTEGGDEEVKKSPSMPAVAIPAHLQSNPLMRVLQKQAMALWRDMDNTGDAEAGVKKVPDSSGGSDDSDDDRGIMFEGTADQEYQMQLMMLERQNAARLAAK